MSHRLLRYNLLARCALLTTATVTCLLGWFSPGSLTARLLESGGAVGHGVLLLMSAVVVLGWLDVLVNDAWPGGEEIAVAWRHEHWGFLSLGALFWAQALAGLAHLEPGAWVLAFNYVMVGALCCWYGWTSALRGGRHG